MRRNLERLASVGVVVGLTTFAPPAAAALCSSIGTEPVVYIENGDTQEPLVKRLGERLLVSPNPVRIVYKNRRTCDLASDVYSGASIVNDSIALKYIPSANDPAAPGWDPSRPTPTCDADAGGNPIDLGIGATFLSSCAGLTKPADVGEFTGPVQSYGFVVPKASSQIAITAQEGYFAYGFAGDTGKAAPWTDQLLRYSRGATASTALTCGAAINVLASKLKGNVPPGNTSTEVLNLVATSTTPEATIGILGTEVFDANRDKVKLLAFKGFGQRFGYFPDSTATSFDKQNVRDGHYLPWAPTPYITHVTAGKANNLNVQRILDLVVNGIAEPDVSGLDEVIASGLVPQCAMRVTRAFDGGNLSVATPPSPCTCYFEAKAIGSTSKCATCSGTDDTPCGGGKCRRGFCEVR